MVIFEKSIILRHGSLISLGQKKVSGLNGGVVRKDSSLLLCISKLSSISS